MLQKPIEPAYGKEIAHGKRNIASKSKTTKRIAII
jgi:hypothetical protein